MSPVARPTGGAVAYVRSALFAGWMFGLALVLGVVGLPLMLGPRRWALLPAKLWAGGVFVGLRLLVGLKVEVRGRENLVAGPCLFASKHQSMLDTLVAVSLCEDPCIVLKRSLMWVPIFGWYCWKVGMVPIDRGGGARTLRRMVAAARKAAALGRQVVIYPEGTRRAPGAEPAYKGGIAILYRELGAPCVRLATNSGRVWPAHGLLKHPGVAVFEVLPALPPGLPRPVFMATLERDLEAASSALL